jgi:hypothetical protein
MSTHPYVGANHGYYFLVPSSVVPNSLIPSSFVLNNLLPDSKVNSLDLSSTFLFLILGGGILGLSTGLLFGGIVSGIDLGSESLLFNLGSFLLNNTSGSLVFSNIMIVLVNNLFSM